MESSRRLRANVKLHGQPCGWCQSPLSLGVDCAVCTSCESPAHATCWDEKQGCATVSCQNAPLRQLAPEVSAAAAEAQLTPGNRFCRHCGGQTPADDPACARCYRLDRPDGLSGSQPKNAPGAVSSLIFGIAGLFVCGMILGIVAFVKGKEAKELIAANPELKGEGYATAGQIIGIIALVLWGVALVLRLTGV